MDFGKLEHIIIDYDKIKTLEDILVVLKAQYGNLGLYTDDPEVKKFAKDSNVRQDI